MPEYIYTNEFACNGGTLRKWGDTVSAHALQHVQCNDAALSVPHSMWQALAALLAVSALLLRSASGDALSGSPDPAAASSGAAQAPPATSGSGASAQGQAAAQPSSAAPVPALYSYKVGSARG